MFDRRSESRSIYWASRAALTGLLAAGVTLVSGAVAQAASTSTSTSTTSVQSTTGAPSSLTACAGNVNREAATDADPHLLGYSFHCWAEASNPTLGTSTATAENPVGGNIWAYTIYVTRPADAEYEIDDFSGNPYVTFPNLLTTDPVYDFAPSAWPSANAAGSVDAATNLSCEQSSAATSINCDAGQPTTSAGKVTNNGYIPESEVVHGDFDLDQSYCKYLPTGAKIGTAAVPQAQVWLIVSDNSGAEDGPFALTLKGGKCPKVANFVTKKTATKKTTTTKKKTTKKPTKSTKH